MTPRVLFIGNFLPPASANPTYADSLTRRLGSRGWSPITASRRSGRIARLVDMLSTTWRTRHAFEVAHISLFSGAAFVWAEAVTTELRALGKPYVVTLHGGLLPSFAGRWPRRVRRLLEGARRVTAPSSFLRTELAPYCANIEVLPNAIELGDFAFRPRAPCGGRMVWVRAFHEVYNPLLAVDALGALANRYPDAHLTMIGPDKGMLEAVRERAAALGVSDRLELVPGVPKADVGKHLAAADIFLNTTTVDNTPVSVLEAMATGLCVVSTSVGGIPHLLENGVHALLVPSGDVDATVAAISRLRDDPGLALALSTQARTRASEHDWPSVLDRWEALFTQVAVS